MKRHLIKIYLIIVLLFVFELSWSQSVYLDPTFGVGGTVSTVINASQSLGARGVAIQPDKKIVVVGSGNFKFALTRYDSIGNVDSSFGTNGKTFSTFLSNNCSAEDVLIQPDGKLLVSGTTWGSVGIARYKANGLLDSLFGTNGFVYTSHAATWDQSTKAIALQSDGKILLAGYSSVSSVDCFMVITRYNSSGVLDNTFGVGGIITKYVTSYSKPSGIAIQTDGKIVISGTSYNGTNNDICLLRYDTNGSIDNSFGTNGVVISNISSDNDEANAIEIQPDGNILICGKSGNNFIVARYTSSGALDNTFGSSGVTLTLLDATNNVANALKLQSDGKIIVSGQAGSGTGVVRYTSNGLIDSAFGVNGLIVTSLGVNDIAYGMALQVDGKIITAGAAQNGTYNNFSLKRFNLVANTNLVSPNFSFAAGYGSGNNTYGKSVCSDSNGNSYVTGAFFGSSITFGTNTLSNAGLTDMFVVKYNNAGNVQWAKSSGASSFDSGNSICVDKSGNVYVTGQFGGTVSFGAYSLSTSGSLDMFVVKYDANGIIQWAKKAGGTNSDIANSVCIDTSGNIYVAGSFSSSSITFGSYSLTNTNTSTNDAFIVKYDNSGNVLWAKKAGINFSEEGVVVKTDNLNNVYWAGVFEGSSITFGSITLTNSSGSGRNIFISKYDSIGNIQWARNFGYTTYSHNISGIAVDNGNNVYITGDYTGASIAFDAFLLNNDYTGRSDVFFVKLDALGNVLWAKREGNIGDDIATGIAINENAYVYLTGYFNSPFISFGNNCNFWRVGSDDVFLGKFDLNGDLIWAKQSAGTLLERTHSVASNINDDVFITGYFQSPSITFDSYTLTNSLSPQWKVFVSKITGDLSNGGNCFAHYTTSYDSLINTFFITIDSASIVNAVSYFWNFGDGTTSTLSNPYHYYSTDSLFILCMKIGTFSGDSCSYCHVIGKDPNGNIVRTNGFYVNVLNPTTNIFSENSVNNEIRIFPNPFSHTCKISFTDNWYGKMIILDVYGREVLNSNISEKEINIERGVMKAGVYFVRLIDNNNVSITRKIIVQ
jgi:uncharacterized delta-60 repeat protein